MLLACRVLNDYGRSDCKTIETIDWKRWMIRDISCYVSFFTHCEIEFAL